MEGPNCYFKDKKTGEEYIGIPETYWIFEMAFLWIIASLLPFMMAFTLQGWGK